MTNNSQNSQGQQGQNPQASTVDTRGIAQETIDTYFHDSQFQVGPIPYHLHTGIDSPQISGNSLLGPVMARTAVFTATATPTPPGQGVDLFSITGATGALSFQPPSGQPVNGSLLRIRITSSNAATARALTWSSATGGYIANSPALPSTTTTGKTSTVCFEYDAGNAANKWRLILSANS